MSAVFSLELCPKVPFADIQKLISKWRSGYASIHEFADRVVIEFAWYTGHENQKSSLREIVELLKARAPDSSLYYFRQSDESMRWEPSELGRDLRVEELFEPANEPTMNPVPLTKHRIV